jgi:hypothetical protein
VHLKIDVVYNIAIPRVSFIQRTADLTPRRGQHFTEAEGKFLEASSALVLPETLQQSAESINSEILQNIAGEFLDCWRISGFSTAFYVLSKVLKWVLAA